MKLFGEGIVHALVGISQHVVEKVEQDEENGLDPTIIAKKIYKASQRKNPPSNIVCGGKYKFLCFIQRLLPTSVVLWIIKKLYKA